jgi:hypothetical protein
MLPGLHRVGRHFWLSRTWRRGKRRGGTVFEFWRPKRLDIRLEKADE